MQHTPCMAMSCKPLAPKHPWNYLAHFAALPEASMVPHRQRKLVPFMHPDLFSTLLKAVSNSICSQAILRTSLQTYLERFR